MLTNQQLQNRSKYVNASEIMAILANKEWSGIDTFEPYTYHFKYLPTPYQLYHLRNTLDADGLAQWSETNQDKFTQGGNTSEEDLIIKFCEKHNYKIQETQKRFIHKNGILASTPDAIILKNDCQYTLEVKAPSMKQTDFNKDMYRMQVLVQVMCTEFDTGILCVGEREIMGEKDAENNMIQYPVFENNPVISFKAEIVRAKDKQYIEYTDLILRASENFMNWLEKDIEPEFNVDNERDQKMRDLIYRGKPREIYTTYKKYIELVPFIGGRNLTEERKVIEKPEKVIKDLTKECGYAETIIIKCVDDNGTEYPPITVATKSQKTSYATTEWVKEEIENIEKELEDLNNPEWIEAWKQEEIEKRIAKRNELLKYYDGDMIIKRAPSILDISVK